MYTVTISFKDHYDFNASKANLIIYYIPPYYKAGHTQDVLISALSQKKGSYSVSFPKEEVANKFANDLFNESGLRNLIDISRDF